MKISGMKQKCNKTTRSKKYFTYFHTLTLPHTILTFKDLKKGAFRKHRGQRRKCLQPAFSPYPTMFSTPPKPNFNFSVTFNLLSANAFNLDQSKNLLFGKELNQVYNILFE